MSLIQSVEGHKRKRTEVFQGRSCRESASKLQLQNIHTPHTYTHYVWVWILCVCIHLSLYCCCCLVTKSCPTLCDPVDYSPSGSSVHGVLQARILEWIVMSSSGGSSLPGDWTHVSCLAGRFFTTEALGNHPHTLTFLSLSLSLSLYIYIYIYTHTHTHTYICTHPIGSVSLENCHHP